MVSHDFIWTAFPGSIMGALEFNLAVTGHEEEKHPEQVTSPLHKERPCPEVTLLKEIPKSFFFLITLLKNLNVTAIIDTVGADKANCFLRIYSAVKITTILCDHVLYNRQGQTQRRTKTVLTTCVTAKKNTRASEMSIRWKDEGSSQSEEYLKNHTWWKKKGRGRSCKCKYSAFIFIMNGCFILQQENKAPTVTLSCLLACPNKVPCSVPFTGSRNVCRWGWSLHVLHDEPCQA